MYVDRISVTHDDVDRDISRVGKEPCSELLHALFDIHLAYQREYYWTKSSKPKYDVNMTVRKSSGDVYVRVPLTYEVYNSILTNDYGFHYSSDLEKIKWFTELYENILVVNSNCTHHYIYTGVDQIQEDDAKYMISWCSNFNPRGYEDHGNIVSLKNPVPCQIHHNRGDHNWALLALGQKAHVYKTHDYLRETNGMVFKAFKQHFEEKGFIIKSELIPSKCEPWQDPSLSCKISFYIMTESGQSVLHKEWVSSYQYSSSSSFGYDWIYDSFSLTIIQEFYPDSQPKPLFRWLVPHPPDDLEMIDDKIDVSKLNNATTGFSNLCLS